MKRYEYKIVSKSIPVAMNGKNYDELVVGVEEEINKLGNDGWKFIQWENGMMIFKREVI